MDTRPSWPGFARPREVYDENYGGRAKLPLPFCHGGAQTAVQGHFSIEAAEYGRNLFFV
jgi:hypothetical protein